MWGVGGRFDEGRDEGGERAPGGGRDAPLPEMARPRATLEAPTQRPPPQHAPLAAALLHRQDLLEPLERLAQVVALEHACVCVCVFLGVFLGGFFFGGAGGGRQRPTRMARAPPGGERPAPLLVGATRTFRVVVLVLDVDVRLLGLLVRVLEPVVCCLFVCLFGFFCVGGCVFWIEGGGGRGGAGRREPARAGAPVGAPTDARQAAPVSRRNAPSMSSSMAARARAAAPLGRTRRGRQAARRRGRARATLSAAACAKGVVQGRGADETRASGRLSCGARAVL